MFVVQQHQNRTLSWWYQERSNIDLEPTYQRQGRLWSDADRAFLIDSILNEFDIPKIYVADFTYINTPLNAKKKRYSIIDGRQRFESVFDFFDGNLVLNQDFEYTKDPSLRLGGLGYVDLQNNHPEIARVFDNSNLTIMSVITDEEPKINELFIRLNRSKPLTGSEVRNAMLGIVPELIRKLAQHVFYQTRIRFQTRRGQALNSAAKMLLIEYGNKLTDTKKISLDNLVVEGRKKQNRQALKDAFSKVFQILDIMAGIFIKKDPLLRSQGPIPLYYWLVRSEPGRNKKMIREFLVHFEQARAQNRDLLRIDFDISEEGFTQRLKEIDQTLALYDLYDRSTNDQQSLEGRSSILQEHLRGYLKLGKRF